MQQVLRFPVVVMVLEALAIIGAVVGLSIGVHAMHPAHGPIDLAIAVVFAAIVVVVWKALLRWYEARPDAEFARPHALGELAAGLGVGFALFCTMALSVVALGGMTLGGWRGAGAVSALWPVIGMALTSGVFEETLFRGVIFRHLETLLGSPAALAITSGLFGAAHLANPDSSWFAALAIAIEAGLLLCAAYMLTRRLWLAIGIHAGWNFTQGWVWSVPVSGGKSADGLLIVSRHGPDWLTGGAFGLEASVPAVACAGLAGVVILVLALRRRPLMPPMWVSASAKIA